MKEHRSMFEFEGNVSKFEQISESTYLKITLVLIVNALIILITMYEVQIEGNTLFYTKN